MVLLDLDGTLLNDEKKIGQKDIKTLKKLKSRGIVNVFATGRNLFSANMVLTNDLALDYLVFSSGAGILNWKTKEIIYNTNILENEIKKIEKILIEFDVNFSIQFPIPENHKYYYHKANKLHIDFEFRNKLYEKFSFKLNNSYPYKNASQFIVILNNMDEFKKIETKIENLKVVRATSPLDNKSIWLEIFSKEVSKANGGKFICDLYNISQKNTLSIGNDYNDIDLLNWTNFSFVVENSPEILKKKYLNCIDNNSNPLTEVIDIKMIDLY